MWKPIVSNSFLSFVAGTVVQFILLGLYISATVAYGYFSTWLWLTIYALSEMVLVCGFLHFFVVVPVHSLILKWTGKDERLYYPLSSLPVCLLLFALITWLTGSFEGRILAFLIPAGLLYGSLWWNRIVVGPTSMVEVSR